MQILNYVKHLTFSIFKGGPFFNLPLYSEHLHILLRFITLQPIYL